jgi:hypothetical protein
MRRSFALLALVAAVFAAGAYAHLAVVASLRTATPEVAPAAPSTERSESDVAARLDRVEQGLRDLRVAVESSSRATVAAAGARPADSKGADGSSGASLRASRGPVSTDGEPALRAAASPDAAKDDAFPTLSTEELRLEAVAAGGTNGQAKDTLGAIRRWKALLARTISPELRAEAQLQLGYAWFGLRESAEAEKSFSALAGSEGLASKNGIEAHRMLGWVYLQRPDPHAALDVAQRTARAPGVERGTLVNVRWIGALAYLGMKDEANAKRELQGIVDDYANDSAFKATVDACRERLAALK